MIYWYLWFTIGVLTVAAFACIVLPKFYLKAIDVLFEPKDRAVGRFNIRDGVSFLYEPDQTAKKFITQYQIYRLSSEQRKRFIGKWARPIRRADYDIVAYDKQNEIIDIINVRESYNTGKYTRSTVLPEETDFVSLKINRIDGEGIVPRKNAGTVFYLWLYAFSASVALVVDLFLWLIVEFAYKCMSGGAVTLSLSLWALILTLVGLTVTLIVFLGASMFLFYFKGEAWKK